MKRQLMMLGLVVTVLGLAPSAHAAPVEYVKICAGYGAGFYYIPGTDICFNVFTGETREETEGGTFVAHAPSAPGDWVPNPAAGCSGGKLIKVGAFGFKDLALNESNDRYETKPIALKLASGEFIAKILMSGEFANAAEGSFCLSFRDAKGQTSLLGCHNTTELRDEPPTWRFTPYRAVPPSTFTSPVTLVGNNADQPWGADVASFDGTVSMWVCVRNVRDTSCGN